MNPLLALMLKQKNNNRSVEKLSNEGKTILVVHHDLESVQHYFNRVILINQRLIGYGDTNVVFTKENIGKTFSSQSHLIQQHF